jgi:hypothetical protein
MIKHVGRHNNKKVAIVFKQVPDEDHMALVVYTESIPSRLHDEMMSVIESAIGQNAKDLGDALFRHTMADGDNCLTAIHKGGYMKKVPTIQVIVTPTSTSSCRLDELNDILRKMEGGEDAVKKLAELDASQGMRGGKEVGEPTKTTSASVNTTSADVLSDADIAKQRLDQATRMEAEANSLLAEAKRLKEEAKSLTPKKTNVRKTTTKKATA